MNSGDQLSWDQQQLTAVARQEVYATGGQEAVHVQKLSITLARKARFLRLPLVTKRGIPNTMTYTFDSA